MDAIEKYAIKLGKQAREGALGLRGVDHKKRVQFLKNLAQLLTDKKAKILSANKKDLANGKELGLSSAMMDRLALTDDRLEGIKKSVLEIAKLPNPLGKKLSSFTRKDKLKIERHSVPIGSILFIFESRPNVTIDGAALCVKSGNSVILRGGKESAKTSEAFAKCITEALIQAGLPKNAVQLVNTPDRKLVNLLLQDVRNLDLVIPRGGERLIETVVEHSKIPVIKHYKGLCHVYIDGSADLKKAVDIAYNAKVQRPGVCNAMESLLIDKKVPTATVKDLVDKMVNAGVEVRGDSPVRKLNKKVKSAKTQDWDEEYLDLVLSVKTVDGVEGAVDHIKKYGSGHTDAVIAKSKSVQNKFKDSIDSSSIMINASTRFSDGGEYGLGAEVGISTDKLHARGPMGIESLTTYQWLVTGQGHIR